MITVLLLGLALGWTACSPEADDDTLTLSTGKGEGENKVCKTSADCLDTQQCIITTGNAGVCKNITSLKVDGGVTSLKKDGGETDLIDDGGETDLIDDGGETD
jgi:hypothetical protein